MYNAHCYQVDVAMFIKYVLLLIQAPLASLIVLFATIDKHWTYYRAIVLHIFV